MATNLTRTPASTTDAQRKTWTYSVWIKPSNILSSGNGGEFAWIYQASGGSNAYVRMDSNYKIRYRDYTNGGSPDYLRITDRLFRDPSAWYHVVLRNDTTQSTAADRVRLYVNGELQEWQNATQPAQNHVGFINSTFPVQIGESSSNALRGSYLSQVIMCAGQSYAPTVFGSTDANGIWVPNSQPSITYGTNGFKLDFAGTGASADASGFGADSSGNNNHFASTGLGTNPSTTDTCQNNFCTLNAIYADEGNNISGSDFSKGNLEYTTSIDGWRFGRGTFSFSAGKWYIEGKATKTGNGQVSNLALVSVDDTGDVNGSSEGLRIDLNGSNTILQKLDTGTGTTVFSNFNSGNIAQLAVDLDSGKVWVGNNGTWYNNNNASTTLNPSYPDFTIDTTKTWVPCIAASRNGSDNTTWQINFGNPTYTVASGNADANGYGNFEYAVPSGFYALCTKNLAAYGG